MDGATILQVKKTVQKIVIYSYKKTIISQYKNGFFSLELICGEVTRKTGTDA
jgi:hypothetical protein